MEMHACGSQASQFVTKFAFAIHYLSFIGFFGKKTKSWKSNKAFGAETHQ